MVILKYFTESENTVYRVRSLVTNTFFNNIIIKYITVIIQLQFYKPVTRTTVSKYVHENNTIMSALNN